MIEIKNNTYYSIKDLEPLAKKMTVLKWINSGRLQAQKVGRRWVMSGKDIRTFLSKPLPPAEVDS